MAPTVNLSRGTAGTAETLDLLISEACKESLADRTDGLPADPGRDGTAAAATEEATAALFENERSDATCEADGGGEVAMSSSNSIRGRLESSFFEGVREEFGRFGMVFFDKIPIEILSALLFPVPNS